MKETKYGFISDVHGDPRVVELAVAKLVTKGIERLVLNGDLGNMDRDLAVSQARIGSAISYAAKAGLMLYVQPGSHESIGAYAPIIKALTGRYGNIVDVLGLEKTKIEEEDHDLVFIPGSDWVCGGEYRFGTEMKTGYKVIAGRDAKFQADNINTVAELSRKLKGKPMHYTNVEDLRRLVTRPDKTIVICHVPRKFSNVHTCVDMADFVQAGPTVMPAGMVREQIRQEFGNISQEEMNKVALANGMEFKVENRGNEGLAKIYDELDIRKAVSGHFHESSHRANDRAGDDVNEQEYVDELFWNSGFASGGQTGILTVREDGKVKYENIDLRK